MTYKADFRDERAKLFLSCGQNPKYEELDWGKKVASVLGPKKIGFDVFFAPTTQDSKSLTQVIFRELEESDYYVLIDFRREKLVPPFHEKSVYHRGSLFAHQEFALACYLGLDLAPFREEGVEPLTGVVGAVMGNAIAFNNRDNLVECVGAHIQGKIERQEWRLKTRNRLQLAIARDTGLPATWMSGEQLSYFHINVHNLHWRKPATNCYAYLARYTCELKWEGTMQSAVRIQPGGYRGLDAFIVMLSPSRELLLMPQTDAQNHINRFRGETNLRITYVVCSDQFPDAKNTFDVMFDGVEKVQFTDANPQMSG
jgi:hypothetical protein